MEYPDPVSRGERQCGSCNVCCIAPPVAEYRKPAWEPCKNLCEKGCSIYEDRPEECRVFWCDWMKDPTLNVGRPDESGVMFWLGKAWNLTEKETIDGRTEDASRRGAGEAR
jgi:hypothetical protein